MDRQKDVKINLDKLESISQCWAEKDGREYYIYTPDWGMFKKRDAEAISHFLRQNLRNIIEKICSK